MRLFEAIIEANHKALAGDPDAGLRPADYAEELPIIALTCIDPRLNPLMPEVLGVTKDQFIWLRNAGNIITGPISSTMRSLSLACAIKGGKEIAIIGHTDCHVGRTTTMELLERLKEMGVERNVLPDNVSEFFGSFSSESANVIKAAGIVRQSPLIGAKIPVHGLLVDINSGKLEWLVNGYQQAGPMDSRWNDVMRSGGQTIDALKPLADFNIGEMKFPESKIGEAAGKAEEWLAQKIRDMEVKTPPAPSPGAPAPAKPPRIPLPPALRPRFRVNPGRGR